jgi:hypothetical protein
MASVIPESRTREDLMEMEGGGYMYVDGITTVTFFDGPVPLEQLKERLVKVVQASPWLAGKLVKKGKKVQMAFDSSPTAGYVLDTLLDQIELDISATMPFESLLAGVKGTKAHVPTGFALLKKGLAYSRFTVVKCANAASWALVFSISHVVADGYTYYKALGMMSSKADVTSLNPARRHSFPPALKAAVGAKEWATVMGSAPMLMNYGGNMMFGGKPRVRAFYIDDDKVKEAKHKSTGTDFVSTNDVLTAFWGRLTGARLVEMSINFRGRLPGLEADDAGNYEGCILFSTADFAEPASIRKALERGDGKFQSTAGRPLPGFCEMRKCKYRIITNWASFFSELEFEGCSQSLHIPYMNPGSLPTDILVIFRPTRSTYGAFVVTRKLSDEALTCGDSLLGKQILPPATSAKKQ